MRQIYSKYKNRMYVRALWSAAILSLFIYIIFRITFFEFTLNWKDEIVFFGKFFIGSLIIAYTVTVGIALFYLSVLKLKKVSRKLASAAT